MGAVPAYSRYDLNQIVARNHMRIKQEHNADQKEGKAFICK